MINVEKVIFDKGALGGVVPDTHYRLLWFAAPDPDCTDPDAACARVMLSASTLPFLYGERQVEGPPVLIPGLLALSLAEVVPEDVLGVIVQRVDYEEYVCVAFAGRESAEAVARALVGHVARVLGERTVPLGYHTIDIELSRCTAPVSTDLDLAPIERLAEDHVANGQFVYPGVIDLTEDSSSDEEFNDAGGRRSF